MATSDGKAKQIRDEGGYTPGQIRALKIAIGIMTAAIILGLAVIVLTIAYRGSIRKPGVSQRLGATFDLKSIYPGSGTIAQGQLPPGGRVLSANPWGEKILLVVEDPSGSSILVLDPKSGRIEPLAQFTPAQ